MTRLSRARLPLGRVKTEFRASKANAGQSAIEFALTIPVLLLLIVGIAWGGQLLAAYEFVSYAAQEAARYAIVRGATSPNPVTADEISSFVTNMAVSVDPNALSVTTTWLPNNEPGSAVQVQVQYNFASTLPFVPQVTIPLSATCQMVIAQ